MNVQAFAEALASKDVERYSSSLITFALWPFWPHNFVATSPSFATGAIDDPPRLINTRPVLKGLHYKRV